MTTTLPLSVLLPLSSGIVYVAAALFLKRATESGVDVWRVTRVCNCFAALFFAPLWMFGGNLPGIADWWQPALVAFLFLLGQMLTMLALRIGDVSVTTPVLGLKIILVAVLASALTQEWPGYRVWVAAILSSIGVALLQFAAPAARSRIGVSIWLASLAAAAYALFDVLVQKWAWAWGVGRFLPLMMGFAALYSLPLGWRRPATSKQALPKGTTWMFAGAACLALQALMLVSSIAIYRHAAVANVLYSSRGLWSVLAVWCLGHWFANQERHHGARILGWRFAGAAMLLAALLIVLLPAPGN